MVIGKGLLKYVVIECHTYTNPCWVWAIFTLLIATNRDYSSINSYKINYAIQSIVNGWLYP